MEGGVGAIVTTVSSAMPSTELDTEQGLRLTDKTHKYRSFCKPCDSHKNAHTQMTLSLKRRCNHEHSPQQSHTRHQHLSKLASTADNSDVFGVKQTSYRKISFTGKNLTVSQRLRTKRNFQGNIQRPPSPTWSGIFHFRES